MILSRNTVAVRDRTAVASLSTLYSPDLDSYLDIYDLERRRRVNHT